MPGLEQGGAGTWSVARVGGGWNMKCGHSKGRWNMVNGARIAGGWNMECGQIRGRLEHGEF